MYDIVLIERELDDGLTPEEIIALVREFKDKAVIPVEFTGEFSTAMGFITQEKAEELLYMYTEESDIYSKITEILDDMEKENGAGEYTFNVLNTDVRVSIRRDL